MNKGLRLALTLCLALAAVTCGGSGGSDGSGEDALAVSGVVRSPNGEAIAPTPIPARHLALAEAPGPMPGLLAVPDGTPVYLVRVDGDGDEVETLASRTTTDGEYRFNLDNLNVGLATDLVLTTGSGASVMRGLVVRVPVSDQRERLDRSS